MKTGISLFRALAFTLMLGGDETKSAEAGPIDASGIRKAHMERAKAFAVTKEAQAEAIAKERKEKLKSEVREFFSAAKKGDAKAADGYFLKLHQARDKGELPFASHWSPVVETSLIFTQLTEGEPEHVEAAIKGLLGALPSRCIYFGGTDPGRGLVTAFCEDHAAGKPFLTITQNQLADKTYLEYLRIMYGTRIRLPSDADYDRVFKEYLEDAVIRREAGKLKPGEDVKMVNGKPTAQGMVAVMEVNGRLAKVIFEQNKNREFYVEESFRLDWMNPYLSAHGLIMKLNAQPVAAPSEEEIGKDLAYWSGYAKRFIGESVSKASSPRHVAEFVEKVYAQRDFSGFTGDRKFIENTWGQKCFGKWRTAMAAIYLWRAEQAREEVERIRMRKAAESAYAQGFSLGPISPEAVYGYVNLLVSAGRGSDARRIAEAALKVTPTNSSFQGLLSQLPKRKE